VDCLPVVIVHGNDAAYAEAERTCNESAAAGRVIILQAERTAEKRRGHPINVGIEYCLTQRPELEFLFFLDDDDIVYPYFTSTMATAFFTSQADVVYAASNRREPNQPAAAGYSPRPIYELLRANFITSNSYAIRISALRDSGLRMAEHLDYLEDWHFLIRMLHSGFRFHPLPATLSEFRLVSDGNLEQKREPAQWEAASREIRRYVNATSFPVPGADLVRMSSPLQDRLTEAQEKLKDAATRLREKSAQAAHHKNLLDEMEQKFLDAQNRLEIATSEKQHYSNLLQERTSESQHAHNLLEESQRHAQHLASSLEASATQFAAEQAAHLKSAQALEELQAKASKIPARWLIR
jgi:hypothetical protein